jgi:PTS system cellobiose-specific IIC component
MTVTTFFENPFVKKLQAWAGKLAANRYLTAVSGGLMVSMGLILLGAFFQIISSLPFWPQAVREMLLAPYNMTMGLMSLVAAFGIAYVLAGGFKLKQLSAAVVSAILFLMVAAPAQTVVLEGGDTMTVLDTAALGGVGIFPAILVALVSVRITKLCVEKKIVLTMPDVVPPFLADSFSSIIPLLFNVILFHGLNVLLRQTMGTTLPMAIIGLLSVPMGALTSTPGIFVMAFVAPALWIFGIHGTMVVFAVLLPLYMPAVLQNGALVEAGQAPVFSPVLITFSMAAVGGTGCTLGMCILGLRSKSEQIKAVCRAAIVPGLFGINEPVIFGLPIVFNPILAIPYIFGSLAVVALNLIFYSVGFLKPPFVLMMSLMPIGVGEFLTTLSWTNVIFPFLMIPVLMLIWYPFFKIYERQLIEKEKEAVQ